MPGGGLYVLVAYGAQNVLLSGNPDFTFFYKTYKKYSHFAEESVTQPLEGPQELFTDQPITLRYKIQRVADLVRDMYLVITLPDIYNKYIDLQDPSQNPYGRETQTEFQWTRCIGCHLIRRVGVYIGGQKIQEFDGQYITVKAQADLDANSYQKWQTLVGDIPELYDPGSVTTNGGYPIVYPDPSNGNLNAPSIKGRDLAIPLPFWFEESTFEALPLLSLQYQECEIQVDLAPIQELYRIRDLSGNYVNPLYLQTTLNATQPINVAYIQSPELTYANIGPFLTDVGTPPPLIPTWEINPRIMATYVYLTDEERQMFASTPLQYLVRQVTRYDFTIVSRDFAEIRTHNPINRMFILPTRTDALNRNDVINWSNWPFYPAAPYLAPITPAPFPNATGQLIQAGQMLILNTLTVFGDGNQLQEEKPVQYYSEVVPWKYLAGLPDPNIIVYPFGLHSPNQQPDGSLNSSRVRLFQVDLNPNPLLPFTNYGINVAIYVENLNWVVVNAGMGGLKYAL
uniref:Major capsid protein N-terminal domain-containing protein n=1 Tax=viral metagenome TaxID=1070528 RepID=A0A6C0DF09_9ZZZZ